MKISPEVRDYAEAGMKEMSRKFREGGSEIYREEQKTEEELSESA